MSFNITNFKFLKLTNKLARKDFFKQPWKQQCKTRYKSADPDFLSQKLNFLRSQENYCSFILFESTPWAITDNAKGSKNVMTCKCLYFRVSEHSWVYVGQTNVLGLL